MKRLAYILFSITTFSILLLLPSATQAATIGVPPKFLPGTGLSQGLVGWWTFDGKDTPWTSATAATTLDKSGSGNTGTLTNMSQTSSPVPGKIGQGLRFDGSDDYVLLSSSAEGTVLDAANTDQWSVAAWVKMEVGGNSNKVVGYWDDGNQQFEYLLAFDDSNKPLAAFSNTANNFFIPTASQSVTLGRWYHLVGTFTRNTTGGAKIYVDGVQAAEVNTSDFAIRNPSTTGVAVGTGFNTYPTLTNQFNGIIDDVRIYNRALSATEISQLYRMGAGLRQATSPQVTNTNCTSGLSCGLVGYWTFDGKDVPNGRANDVSGNGNHGTLTNIATSTFYVSGKIGQGFRFDGVDDTVIAPSSLGTLTTYTSCLWMKPNFSDTDSTFQTIFLRQATPVTDDELRVAGFYWFGSSNRFQTDSKAAYAYGMADSIASFSAGQWHHICFSYGGNISTSQFYWDGIARTTTQVAWFTDSPNNTANLPFYIGSQGLVGSRYFDGTLDEVRVYNRVLSAAEVQQLYNMGR